MKLSALNYLIFLIFFAVLFGRVKSENETNKQISSNEISFQLKNLENITKIISSVVTHNENIDPYDVEVVGKLENIIKMLNEITDSYFSSLKPTTPINSTDTYANELNSELDTMEVENEFDSNEMAEISREEDDEEEEEMKKEKEEKEEEEGGGEEEKEEEEEEKKKEYIESKILQATSGSQEINSEDNFESTQTQFLFTTVTTMRTSVRIVPPEPTLSYSVLKGSPTLLQLSNDTKLALNTSKSKPNLWEEVLSPNKIAGAISKGVKNIWKLSKTKSSDPLNVYNSILKPDPNLLILHQSLVLLNNEETKLKLTTEFLVKYLSNKNFTVELCGIDGSSDALGLLKKTLSYNSSFPFEINDKFEPLNIYAYFGEKREVDLVLVSHIADDWGQNSPVNHISLTSKDNLQNAQKIKYHIENGNIYGTGVAGYKASMAAMIHTIEKLAGAGRLSVGSIGLLFVVGNGVDGRSIEAASNNLGVRWNQVIFGEPTDNKLAIGHMGKISGIITSSGPSLSSSDFISESSNRKLIKTLEELSKIPLPSSRPLGKSKFSITSIRTDNLKDFSGSQAKASFEIHLSHGSAETIIKRLNKVISNNKGLNIFIENSYDPFITNSKIPGFKKTVLPFTTDIPNFNGGKTMYIYGPGDWKKLDTPMECISSNELFMGVKGYTKLITYALNQT